MRQAAGLKEKNEQGDFMKAFRNIFAIRVVFLLCIQFGAQFAVAVSPAVELYRAKEYKKVIELIESQEIKEGEVLPYASYAVLIRSYHKTNDLNGKIKSLKNAARDYPKKDIFKREMAHALEHKSNAYADTKPYTEVKKDLKLKAVTILSDLYDKSPTKENFTALIAFYNREKNYVESIGLLELYGRVHPKGRIYYTYLCEAQYNSMFYVTAAKTCGALKSRYPKSEKGHIFFGKSLEKTGETKAAAENFMAVVGRFPASSSIQYEAGKALISKGDKKNGLKHLNVHIKLEASDEGQLLRAVTLFEMNKYDEALKAFEKACKERKGRRKPLVSKLKEAARKFAPKTENRIRYDQEVRRCRYSYNTKRKMPKGLLGGSYTGT